MSTKERRKGRGRKGGICEIGKVIKRMPGGRRRGGECRGRERQIR